MENNDLVFASWSSSVIHYDEGNHSCIFPDQLIPNCALLKCTVIICKTLMWTEIALRMFKYNTCIKMRTHEETVYLNDMTLKRRNRVLAQGIINVLGCFSLCVAYIVYKWFACQLQWHTNNPHIMKTPNHSWINHATNNVHILRSSYRASRHVPLPVGMMTLWIMCTAEPALHKLLTVLISTPTGK